MNRRPPPSYCRLTITTTSPLGQALMGARPADQVSYEAPGGTFRCVVVSFRPISG